MDEGFLSLGWMCMNVPAGCCALQPFSSLLCSTVDRFPPGKHTHTHTAACLRWSGSRPTLLLPDAGLLQPEVKGKVLETEFFALVPVLPPEKGDWLR